MFDEGLRFVLGPVAGAILPEMLLDQGRVRSSSGPSPDTMDLRGKRVVWASETSQGAKLDSARAKLLSGGDELVGRWPHSKRPIHFKPTHTIFMLTNRKPYAPADDYALWRRLHLIPFSLSFVDDPIAPFERQRDPELINKLSQERPGILRWLVNGCLEWQRWGLKPPASVTEATQEYRNDEDIIGHFLEERCFQAEHSKTKAADLYEAYCEWAKGNGYRAISAKSFGSQIGKDHGRIKTHGITWYKGLELSAPEE